MEPGAPSSASDHGGKRPFNQRTMLIHVHVSVEKMNAIVLMTTINPTPALQSHHLLGCLPALLPHYDDGKGFVVRDYKICHSIKGGNRRMGNKECLGAD